MENFLDIFKSLSNSNQNSSKESNNPIPKEILDQYPYGQFPIKYTRSGQETIRKQSENRYSYSDDQIHNEKQSTSFDLSSLSTFLPIIQALSGGKKNSKDLMNIFGKILFKDNPELQKIFNLLPKTKSQEIDNSNNEVFNTKTVNITSLKRINWLVSSHN